MDETEDRRQGEGFLAGWSRRKSAAKRARTATHPASNDTDNTADESGLNATESDPDDASGEPEVSEEELAALPTIEEVSGDTDLQPFLKRGVPDAIRKAALRKVWLSKALIRDHDDPAVDYAWDWNSPEGVPGAGGIIGKDKASKMVDDLINKERPATQTEDPARGFAEEGQGLTDDPDVPSESAPSLSKDESESGDEGAGPNPPPDTEDPIRLTPSGVSRQGEGRTEISGALEGGIEAGIENPVPLSRRSHGGAVPS